MKPIKIGIAGLGNVGEEVAYQLIKGFRVQEKLFQIELVAVSARSKNKKRKVDINNLKFFDNPTDMVSDNNIDVIVELIGGDEGVAKDLCFSALKNNKAVITANKALIVKYGKELAEIAEEKNLFFSFEASVAGGIPILKLIREGLIVNDITKLTGILNGTTNYILSEMEKEQKSFDIVLKEAQIKGFAEADPYDDISGTDAAYKLIILSNLSFGINTNIKDVHLEGIDQIEEIDIRMARKLNYEIILLGIASFKNKRILQRVHPCLLSKESIITKVKNELNTLVIEDNHAGKIMLVGKGAGSMPTSSAVVSDILNYKDPKKRVFDFEIRDDNKKFCNIDLGLRKGNFYIRLMVEDKPGVLADITAFFKSEKVSIKSMFQLPEKTKKIVPLILITHKITEKQISFVVKKMNKMSRIRSRVKLIRIEDI